MSLEPVVLLRALTRRTRRRRRSGPCPVAVASAGALSGRRVVQVSTTFAPYVGGVERVVEELAHQLHHEGSQVEVHTTGTGAADSPRRECVGGVSVVRHRAFSVLGLSVSFGLFVAMLRLPRSADVHVHVPHAGTAELVGLARCLRRSPYVVHDHLDAPASTWAGRLLPLYHRLLLGPTLRRAAAVLVLTEAMARHVVSVHGVDPRAVTRVHNGVRDLFRDDTRTQRDAIGSPDRPARLLFVGRLSSQKNPALFVDAVTRTRPEVEAVMVGDGPLRSAVERRVARSACPDRIRVAGQLDATGVRDRLRWADVVVSTSDVEGMPLVCLEAFAAGVPVVATDVPGTRELVLGVGAVVPATPAALATEIELLLGDRERREDLARRGRERAAALSWERVRDEVVLAYDRARAVA